MDQHRLKTSLKLKWLDKELDEMAEENFGYSPSCNPYFDKLLAEQKYWVEVARMCFPDMYKEFMDTH